MNRVVLRYWASARAAAGVDEDVIEGVTTLAQLLAAAVDRHPGTGLAHVLGVCSYLVDEHPAGTRDPASIPLADGCVVEALPPFAGG